MNTLVPLMIAPSMLAFAQAATTPLHPHPPPSTPALPAMLATPPADWSVLPELAFRRRRPVSTDLSYFVRDEIRTGRCAAPGAALRIDLAVLVGANGRVRRIVPRAIDCPTVEQYASGLVSRMARGNVAVPNHERWYRTALTFAWRE